MDIELTYFRFDEPFPHNIQAHSIDPTNEEKRLRVFSNQLMDDIIGETNLSNFYFNVSIFFRLGEKLKRRFPKRTEELDNTMFVFWQKMQIKYKELNKGD